MKKIGFVDYYISEWHANNYPIWINELTEDLRITHVWAELDISPVDGRTTEEWCSEFGTKRCASIEELCKSCDYIIILAPSDPEKHLEYATEVLKFGKPTYIDKTFAPDLNTAKKIFDMAKRYSTPFFSTSALRYADELDALCDYDSFIITGGGSSFDEYSVHTIEMAVKLMGSPIESASSKSLGNQRVCFLDAENGKKASIIYSPKLSFSVTAEKGCTSVYAKITSDFFKNLMKDILRFFNEGTVSFAPEETLEVMKAREALIALHGKNIE